MTTSQIRVKNHNTYVLKTDHLRFYDLRKVQLDYYLRFIMMENDAKILNQALFLNTLKFSPETKKNLATFFAK